MRVRGAALICLLGYTAAAVGTASAQQPETPGSGLLASERWSGSLDVRNRFVQQVGGSNQVYRSVVNLGEGPRLFDGNLRFRDADSPWLDRLQLDMSSWGGDPYNTARLEAGKSGVYELDFHYRNIAYFNNLPSFANPLLEEGLLVSQRALDVTRRQVDFELTGKPGSRISPYLAVYRADGFGSGLTSFVTGGNEFPVETRLDDALTSVRGGVNLTGRRWSAVLEQGRTSYTDEQDSQWNQEPNRGNRRTPFLGQDLRLDRFSQRYRADGSGSFSRVVLQAQPIDALRLSGQFLYSKPEIDASQQFDASGLFVSQQFLQFYTGGFEQSLGDANRPRSSGSWTTEIRPSRRLRIVQSWFTDRYHISSGASLTQILNSTPERTLEEQAIQTLRVDYNRHQVDLIFDPARWIGLRAGHRIVWGEAEVSPATLQFTSEPRTDGEIRRHVGLAGAAMRFYEGRLRVSADFEASPGDKTFFRTGLMDYRRVKLRARYKVSSELSLSSALSTLDNRNSDPAVDLDFSSRQASLTLHWAPAAARRFSLLADYTRSTLRSDVLAVQLPFFGSSFARYRDNGHHGGLFADLLLASSARLRVGGSLSANSGSRPTRYYSPQAEFTAPLRESIRFVAQWRWYGFSESFFHLENFRTHSFSAGFRFGL